MNSTTHLDKEIRGQAIEINLREKLSRKDYDRVVPETGRTIRECGIIRMLATMDHFHGGDAGALWKDMKWNRRHFQDTQAARGRRKGDPVRVGDWTPPAFELGAGALLYARADRFRTRPAGPVKHGLCDCCGSWRTLAALCGFAGGLLLAGCESAEPPMKHPHIYRGGTYYEDAVHPDDPRMR